MSVLILNVLILLYFSLSFLKIKFDIKLYGHHLLTFINFKLNPSINNAQASS